MGNPLIGTQRSVYAALLYSAVLVACGGGTSPIADAAVSVSATSPANAATGVALNSGLSATFNEPLDPSSITAASFTLLCGTTPVVGAVYASGVTATFLPSQPLAANSSYTARIAASAKSHSGIAMASSYSWTFTTGTTANVTAPTVTSTSPATGATSVPINTSITATFSESMAPATLVTTTFLLAAAGSVAITGTVTYSGLTAVFHPAAALPSNTVFTATITQAASNLSGKTLAAEFNWTFTTGIAPDTTPPTVSSTIPTPDATAIAATAALSATFSKSISPATINSATFTLSGPGGVAVPGTVSFDAATNVATFQASASLAAHSGYVATIHGAAGGVSDVSGNLLISDHAWSFTTGGRVLLTPILLGSSANYAVLAKTAISTVPASKITGDIALSPAAATFITGFSLVADSTNAFSTSPQVVGKLYAAPDSNDPDHRNLRHVDWVY